LGVKKNREVVEVKKESRMAGFKQKTLLFVLLGFFAVIGCTGKAKPDLDRLTTELDNILQANQGKETKGNADIYKIVGLKIGNTLADGEDRLTVQFTGDFECLRGFYMFADGRYSYAKPKEKARWHVSQGTMIRFTGTMDFELSGNAWTKREHRITLSLKYAPPI
jgi:hypothetical protein